MRFSRITLALVALLTAACDVHETTAPAALASLTLTPPNTTLGINGLQQYTVVGRDIEGRIVTVAPTWSVAAGGGTITGSGIFTAGTALGSFPNTVKATVGSISATANVTVVAGPLATITVTPNPITLAPGATQQYTAVGRDAGGNVIPISPVWDIAAGGGAINAAGLFTAGGLAGTFTNTVRATVGGLSGTATVTVVAGPLATIVVTPDPATVAINATQQFTASGRDANGNVVAITPVWSLVNGGGTLNASGLFTAGTVTGTYLNTIRATSGTLSATATVVVTGGPLATITVTPNPATMPINGLHPFVAVGRDASGNVVPITPVWSVANGGGTITQVGLFTAGTVAGTFTNTVRATVGALVGTATVVVTPGALASITVTPNPAVMIIGTTQQFTAVGRDASNNIVPITPVWSVTNGGGAINGTGLFTAGAVPGTFDNTVRATSGAIFGTATAVISAGPLFSITVTPNPANLAIGGTQQFTAVGRDASNNIIPITPVWTVTNGGGTINATGLFTAGNVSGAFANTVRATVGPVFGTATVNVAPGALNSITVTPNPAGVAVGATQQFTAVGRDINNNIVPIVPVWSVVNGGGTTNASGLFTAGAVPGTFLNTMRATSGAISGTATVVVAAGPLASITVTPNPASVAVNATQQFTAVGRDAMNNIIPVNPVWSIVNGGGTINQNGLLTAANVAGVHPATVRATSGIISGSASLTVTAAAPPPLIPLGNAAPNGIMAGQAVSCISGGLIVADISIAPGSTLGLGACVQIGVAHLNDAVAQLAQNDLTTAYNTLMGLPCPLANAIVADLGGTTKLPGVYCTASGIGVTGTLTLDGNGDPNATFVFQAGTSLTTAGNIVLINGAQAKNVYWGVGSSATLGTASLWQGNILALTSITMVTNATLNGRALARNGSVTLGTGNSITLP